MKEISLGEQIFLCFREDEVYGVIVGLAAGRRLPTGRKCSFTAVGSAGVVGTVEEQERR